MTTTTSLKGYAIGSANEPGDYLRLNGYFLCNEGAFEVQSTEEFQATVKDLRDNCGWEGDFALVETDENGDKSIIEWA